MSAADAFALMPDPMGGDDLHVCGLADLADRLADGETLPSAISNAAIDSFRYDDISAIYAVEALNRTGDATAYWKLR